MKKFSFKMFVRFSSRIRRLFEGEVKFDGMMNNSSDILIILPEDPELLSSGVNFAIELRGARKNVTVLIPGTVNYNELVTGGIRRIDYGKDEFGLFRLPSGKFRKKLSETSFDIVIDLNLADYSSLSLLTAYPQAKYRVGFRKLYGEKFYNLMFVPGETAGEKYTELLKLIINL